MTTASQPQRAQPAATPAAAPAPATTPAAAPDTAPPLTWCYPFQDKNHKEVKDPQTFYEAFGRMEDGFYPLGVNGFPHGGVHFGEATSLYVDVADGVRCLADGEIVAYKLDDKYDRLHFTQDDKWAMYSTGFVLVRHRLVLPPAPGGTASPDDTQNIYSLYMHMADWTTYLADGALKRPGWWIGVKAFRIGKADQQAGGSVHGANVRTEPKAAQHGRFTAGDLVGLLPEDSEVVVGEIRGPWGHITALTAGHMISPNSGDTFGGDDDLDAPWHSPDDSDTTRPVTPTGDYGWIYLHDQHAVTEPTAVGSVVIPPEPIPIKGGTLLGQLGEYLDYERSTPLPPVPSRQLLHLEVFAHESFKTFLDTSRTQAAQLPADQKTILTINPGAKLVPTAIPSNGTLSNHYRPLHDVQVTPDSPAAGRWVKVQPRIINSAVIPRDPVWIERSALASAAVGTPTWSRFPLQLAQAAEPSNGFLLTFTRAELDAFDADSHAVDDQGVHWWHVQYGASDGKPARGWVCEKNHPNTSWQSPWAWPGFEIVDATDIALTDAFLRNLVVTGSADWQEEHKFKTSVDTVNNTRLLRKLDQLVSKLPPSERRTSRNDDPSNRVTARAIQEVLKTPWLAQPLTHLILRYESEWGGNMTRWEAITPLMRNARENWECELQRIGKLQWWNDVKGKVDGLPGDPKVYHIHPIALVGNFRRPAALVCAHCDSDLTITSSLLKQIFSDIHPETAEGFAPELNTAFQKYEINTCHRIAHFFGQCAVECAGFTAFRENLRYTNGDYLWRTYTTALTRGLKRIHPDWSHTQIEEYSKTKLINNDPELGMVLFGDDAYPNADFRGRGLLHVTWKATYEKYKNCGGKDVLSDPTLMQRDRRVATDASAWYWSDKSINAEADDNNVEQVTRKINPALMDFDLRKSAAKKAFSLINKDGEPCKHNWESMLTREHGW